MSNLFQFYFCRDALELIPKRGQLRRSQVIGAHHQGRRRTFILHLRIAPKPLSVDVLQEILEASDHAANAVGQGRPLLILHLLVLIDWWSWRRSWQRSSGLRTASGLNKTGNVIDLYKVLVSFLEVAGSSTVLSVFYDITPIERRPVPLVVGFRIKVELEARHDSVRNLAGTANPVGTAERDGLANANLAPNTTNPVKVVFKIILAHFAKRLENVRDKRRTAAAAANR